MFDRRKFLLGASALSLSGCKVFDSASDQDSALRQLFASHIAFDDPRAAADQNEKCVGRIALPNNHFAEFKVFRSKALAQPCLMGFGYEAHQGACSQYVFETRVHGAVIGERPVNHSAA